MARISWSCNDVILLGALGYSAAVLFMKWSSYSLCRYPLHIYLLVDYTIIFLFRLAHLASQYFSDHSPCVQKFVNFIKIGFLYLFFIAWTIVGTVWFTFSSDCFSEAHQYWTLIFWLGLCYVWIALYLCLIILQFTLRADPQLQHIGVLEGRSFLPSSLLLRLTEMSNQTNGLPQYRIDAIPLCDAPPPSLGQDSCAVCIEPFCKDDICKKLPSCPHYFHAPCIDSWLRRKDDCPVCRTAVVVPVDHTAVVPASGSFRQLHIHPPLSPHLGGPDSFRCNFSEPTPTYAAPSSFITHPACVSLGDTPLQPHRVPITDFVVCDNDLDMEIGADSMHAGLPERSHSSTEVTDGYRSVSVPHTLHRLQDAVSSPRSHPPFTASRSLPNVYIDVATSDPDATHNGEIQQDPNPF